MEQKKGKKKNTASGTCEGFPEAVLDYGPATTSWQTWTVASMQGADLP